MTFFLHIPELEEGMAKAQQALGTVTEKDTEETQAKLIAMLDQMLTFAEDNLAGMLNLMGFSSIDELNEALRNYNNLNLSLQQLFPAFSAPQLSNVLAAAGIGGTGERADYGLLVSALEDRIYKRFEDYAEQAFLRSDMQSELREKLNDSEMLNQLGIETAAQLFGGIDIDASTVIVNFSDGSINWGNTLSNLTKIINQSAKERGATGTNTRTLEPFIRNLFIPYVENMLNQNIDFFINENSYQIFESELRNFISQQPTSIQKKLNAILRERVQRGGITVSTKLKTTMSSNGDNFAITTYLDTLQVGLDPSIFNLSARGNKSIETYVNDICKEYPEIREQITQNIKDFYWNIVNSYIPTSITNPLDQNKFNSLIDQMVSEKSGNIGWFFSQGGTKALGAGMFGEVAGMIYMSVLCPKLKNNAEFIWAGGVTEGAKPPADMILGNALKQYGIQIKNYTSGSTLSHDYGLRIKNIVDEAARNNSDNKVDLMTLQATSELGITEDEIEAVQNVIIANTFNIPYKKIGDVFEAVDSVPSFMSSRAELSRTYQQATRYMALISVIMHRLQYADEITRKVSATTEERQLQNTLWLVNGNLFISSVQILNELKQYVIDSVNRFFSISTSVRISGDKLPEGINEGNFTIVEYYNYSAKGLGTTALSKVSARIGTNYKTSAFNR